MFSKTYFQHYYALHQRQLFSVFVILNGVCLVFAVAGNVLEKCCLTQKCSGKVLFNPKMS